MEFTIAIDVRAVDIAMIDEALRDVDPAALVDADASGLRVAGAFDIPTLQAVLEGAGHRVDEQDIRRLPSVCCGGCSG